MSDLNSNSSGKKSYQPPFCARKSISEIGELFRNKTLHLRDTVETPSAPELADVQVLIVEDYCGDLLFLRPTARSPGGLPGSFPILRGEGVEMRFADHQDTASSETFLLFDLRRRSQGGRRILESIGRNPDFDNAVPGVILATSLEQVRCRLGIDPKHCWQLRNCLSPTDLMTALRSFLHLTSALLKGMPEKGSAGDKPAVYALIGKPDIE